MTLDNDQRSIVQRILAKYLDGQALDQAVELWRYQYSKKPLQELNYFVFEIANSSELRSSRKQIVHDLQHGLEHDVQQNLNDEKTHQSTQAFERKSKNNVRTLLLTSSREPATNKWIVAG